MKKIFIIALLLLTPLSVHAATATPAQINAQLISALQKVIALLQAQIADLESRLQANVFAEQKTATQVQVIQQQIQIISVANPPTSTQPVITPAAPTSVPAVECNFERYKNDHNAGEGVQRIFHNWDEVRNNTIFDLYNCEDTSVSPYFTGYDYSIGQ